MSMMTEVSRPSAMHFCNWMRCRFILTTMVVMWFSATSWVPKRQLIPGRFQCGHDPPTADFELSIGTSVDGLGVTHSFVFAFVQRFGTGLSSVPSFCFQCSARGS